MVPLAQEGIVTGGPILALETATPVCSVALAVGGRLLERRSDKKGAHAESMPGFVKEVLEEAGLGMDDLEAVVLSAGPGSYTGLRIGASLAKGLLFGRQVPLLAANTLAAIAVGVPKFGDEMIVHAVVDARRTHLYHQSFRIGADGLEAISTAEAKELAFIESILLPGETVAGTGWQRLDPEALEGLHRSGPENISALHLVELYRLSRGSETAESDRRILWAAAARQFEPDYRGNPYQG